VQGVVFAVVYEEHEGRRIAAASVFGHVVGGCDHTRAMSKTESVLEFSSRDPRQLSSTCRYGYMYTRRHRAEEC
jgi:hypothetical protein